MRWARAAFEEMGRLGAGRGKKKKRIQRAFSIRPMRCCAEQARVALKIAAHRVVLVQRSTQISCI